MAEQHLFILWENARIKETEILEDLKSTFKILKEYEIFWDEDKFRLNLGSFYSEDFEFDTYQEEIRGKGPFLAILVEDNNPIYKDEINQNTFKFKHKWRNILGSFTVHGTDTVRQMSHDICLLTSQSISDILKNEILDGSRVQLHQNLPCVEGWKSLEQIFYVLNETVNYVILRPYDFDIKTHKMSINGDIDILTDDFFEFSAVLNACKDVQKNAFKFFNWTKHDNDLDTQLIHIKFVGDNYYDEKWQKYLLDNKIQNNNCIYILKEEDYFWTLLFHGLVHKSNYNKYNNQLQIISDKYSLNYKNDKKYLTKLLQKYLQRNNYKIDLHIDNIAGKLEKIKLVKKFSKKDDDLYFFSQGELGSLVLSKKLIYINPCLTTRLISYYNRIVRLEGHQLLPDNKLYKKHKKLAQKNELAWFYKRRFGKVVKTTFYLQNNEIWIKRELLNKRRYCGNNLIHFVKEKPRKYIDGENFYLILQKNRSDKETFKNHLEVYIAEVFRQFALPNSNLLNPKIWDCYATNCIITPDGSYNFFDFEYAQNSPIDKSYALYRILCSASLGSDFMEYWNYFINKFNLEDKLKWCEFYEDQCFKDILKDAGENEHSKLLDLIIKLFTNCIPIKKTRKKIREKFFDMFYRCDMKLFMRYFR